MAYSLWNALQLTDFIVLDDAQEAAEAEEMLHRLSKFIFGPACLLWIATAMIINYKGRFPQLLRNAVAGWDAARKTQSHPFEAFAAYSRVRTRFCQDYAYILAETGLCGSDAPLELIMAYKRESQDDKLAQDFMGLGKYWHATLLIKPDFSERTSESLESSGGFQKESNQLNIQVIRNSITLHCTRVQLPESKFKCPAALVITVQRLWSSQ
ncbi:hypothetical protein GGR57DRAFT_405973 [Xylariaceae sp. FL1272]|nr:hypothetical protein GGR57DRAFT_405973 [Xylariaceae sp. FL1272]